MSYGILVDTTKCIGCRGCQVACKRWNELSPQSTFLSNDWTNPRDFDGQTWTYVQFTHQRYNGSAKWFSVKKQCMHCLRPPCEHVCPVKAIRRLDEGPVIIDQTKCIGCRYCVQACPWHIPRFDVEGSGDIGKISTNLGTGGIGGKDVVRKCHMCFDRVLNGEKPACVSTCPPRALEFGERESLLQKARARADAINGYVYGEKENGGTGVIYVLPEAPHKLDLGLPVVAHEQYMKDLDLMRISAAGFVAGGLTLFLLWTYARKKELAEQKLRKKEKEKKEKDVKV